MLEADNLCLSFASAEGEIASFRGVSFRAKGGELIGVTGQSGSGKTGLLMALGGYLPYWAPACELRGSLSFSGRPVRQGEPGNDTAIVIENPYNQNTGFKSGVFEELLVPLEMRGIAPEIMRASARCLANRFGLSHIRGSKLESLSGGELQRLHIASALIARPNLLLLDQVLAELDQGFQQRLFTILRSYAGERKAVILLSFNPGETDLDSFDTVVNLSRGVSETVSKPVCKIPAYLDKTAPTPAGQKPAIRLRDLSFRYSPRRPWLFESLNLEVSQGRGCLILGPNGSGKSTLGKLILGILKPDGGSIEVSGRDFARQRKPRAGSAVNCAFQNPDLYFCKRSVKEELEFGTDKELAYKLANLTGLSDHLDKNPYDLPRGLRKRLSFAIAGSSRPEVLYLDEPSQYQDATGVEALIEAMRFLLDQKTALLCCSHDRRIVDEFSDFPRLVLGGESRATKVSHGVQPQEGRPAVQPLGLFGGKTDVGDARAWFQNTWREAIEGWIDIGRQRSRHDEDILQILIEKIRGDLSIDQDCRILDLGCGDGIWLMLLGKWLDENGLTKARLLGIDVQQALIDHARWRSIGRANTHFEAADLAEGELIGALCGKTLGGKATLATCAYVLHDEPELTPMLRTISDNVEKNGLLVCILAHPEWASALASKGFVKIVQRAGQNGSGHWGRSTPDWRWLGLYPLMEVQGRTVYLPHAFRILDDYEKAIAAAGFSILSVSPLLADGGKASDHPVDVTCVAAAEQNFIAHDSPPSVLIIARKL